MVQTGGSIASWMVSSRPRLLDMERLASSSALVTVRHQYTCKSPRINLPTFSLVASFVELELFERHPETFFLMANGLLSLCEFLLFHFDPFRVKPDTILYLDHVTMEVL